MVTEPVAVIAARLVAVAVWSANVRAIAAPMAAEPELVVSPDAVVSTDASVDASSSALPLVVNGVSFSASDLTLLIVIATAGATLTPPPDAPVFASVIAVLRAVAVRSRATSVPVTMFGNHRAVDLIVTMFSATAAPTPTLDPPPPPLVPGSAFDVVRVSDAAVSVVAPAPSVTTAVGPTNAVVVTFAMTSENEPARPTDPPPAPLVDCAEMSFVAADGISAMTDSPVDDTAPSTRASVVMFASVIATPAPMPSEPPVEAWPSAADDASVVSRARSVRRPPLVIVTPAGTAARELAFASVTATAAATLIGPVEVEAAGVAPVALELSPVAAVEAPSACARSLLTCPVTPPDGAPVSPSPGAPAAEAVADEEVVDGPRASNVTAPSALMSRAVVASAV